MSDGREGVHQDIVARGWRRLRSQPLEESGTKSLRAREVVGTTRLAVSEAKRIAEERLDLTILNIPVWAFRTSRCWLPERRPDLLLFSNINPEQPAVVGACSLPPAAWIRSAHLRPRLW